MPSEKVSERQKLKKKKMKCFSPREEIYWITNISYGHIHDLYFHLCNHGNHGTTVNDNQINIFFFFCNEK